MSKWFSALKFDPCCVLPTLFLTHDLNVQWRQSLPVILTVHLTVHFLV